MPYAFDLGAAIGDDAAEHRQRPRVEAAIVRHIHVGLKPELGLSPVLEDVDMNRLERIAFVGIEEETEAVVAENDGHVRVMPQAEHGSKGPPDRFNPKKQQRLPIYRHSKLCRK